MGVYTEYLDRNMSFPELSAERKKQLARISKLRGGRDILVYAADARKHRPPEVSAMIQDDDLLPISDQLSNLNGQAIDVILETPGGYAQVVEDIVRAIRHKYPQDVAFIVPGSAKSAGTIMAMSGNDILLDPDSSLGPIDAQLAWQGKQFSAEAFLEGLRKIKEETEQAKALNRAYIPILQNISPGEIQHAENALAFAKTLVTDWLCTYKFQHWTTHSSTGRPVTPDERRARAREIADQLCNHSRWLSHARSIKLADLVAMRLKITDYSQLPDLADAIRRYHTLLRMTFETNIYKVMETPTSQIFRFVVAQQAPVAAPAGLGAANKAFSQVPCAKCGKQMKIQVNFEPGLPLDPGCLPYPKDDILKCPDCNSELNLTDMRRQLEALIKKEVARG
jgi:hypothetical protein